MREREREKERERERQTERETQRETCFPILKCTENTHTRTMVSSRTQ